MGTHLVAGLPGVRRIGRWAQGPRDQVSSPAWIWMVRYGAGRSHDFLIDRTVRSSTSVVLTGVADAVPGGASDRLRW